MMIDKNIVGKAKVLTTQFYDMVTTRRKTEYSIKKLPISGSEKSRLLKEYRTIYASLEADLRVGTDQYLNALPIWKYFLSKVSDLDDMAALALIIGIEDITRFASAAKLWAYCGMNTYMVDKESGKKWFKTKQMAINFVEKILRNKKSQYKTVDELLNLCVWGSGYDTKKTAMKDGTELGNWNAFLKKVCEGISKDFDQGKGNGFYHQQIEINGLEKLRRISGFEDHNFEKNNLTDLQLPAGLLAQINSQARRTTIHLFLTHLLQYWRQMEGLPIKKPVIKNGGKIITFPGMPLEFTIF